MAKQKKEMPTGTWDLIVQGLSKKFGDGLSIFNMGTENSKILKVEVFPTNLVSLDNALGVFGFPKGRVIEIYGPESGGKTTLALHMIKAIRTAYKNHPILYVDLEHALDRTWMETVGVSFDNLWVSQPSAAETALQLILSAAESGETPFIVLDSIPALVPQVELDGQMTDQQMGTIARILGKFFRKITSSLKKNNTTLFCINQIRQKLGPISGETRPGGNALKYWATMILRVSKESPIKVGDEIAGVWIKVEVKKNKVAPPFKSAIIPLLFDSGFSKEMDLINFGVQEGIVDKKGAWFSYQDQQLGQGILNSSRNLTPELFDKIYQEIKDLKMDGVIIEPEQEEVLSPETQFETTEFINIKDLNGEK